MPTIYLDSSVLIAFLYEKQDQTEKYEQSDHLFTAIRQKRVAAIVSFYALPELYDYVRDHQIPRDANTVFRLSLVELFDMPLWVAPYLKRDDLNRLRQQFSMGDADDVRHVAAALHHHCDAIITFDHDFQQVAALIPAFTPAEFLATLESADDD